VLPPGESVRTATALARFPNPPSFDAPARGDPVGISGWNLYRIQERDGATVWWKLHDPKFNRFRLSDPPVWRTDRQTDRRICDSMLSRAKNCSLYIAYVNGDTQWLTHWKQQVIKDYITHHHIAYVVVLLNNIAFSRLLLFYVRSWEFVRWLILKSAGVSPAWTVFNPSIMCILNYCLEWDKC